MSLIFRLQTSITPIHGSFSVKLPKVSG